ncbi:MAG: hypothetical protein SF162_06870 [bacterium]|nr:hypothetical protein [bacterium]
MNIPNPPTRADLPLSLLTQFQQRYPDKEMELVLQAPGRDLWIMAAHAASGRIALDCVELKARTTFTLWSARHKRTVLHRPLPKWARYAAGVAVRMSESDLILPGLYAVVSGDEPPGPRYEHTLGVLFAAVIHTLHDQPFTHARLIDITDKARREYVEAH